MKYKAVLFDLDGTLLNTIEDLGDSMNIALESYNFPIHDMESYKYFVGNGIKNMVIRALPKERQNDEILITNCIAKMKEEYDRRLTLKTRPYSGISELLDSLIAKKINIAVFSNKPDPAAKRIVKELLSRWQFDCILGERPGVSTKPDPTGAIEITKILNIKPEEFIYLGDSGVDMQTAINAGMFGVGASWGFRTVDELEKNGAKLIIEKPDELLKLF